MNYYAVYYKLFNKKGLSIGIFSKPISAKDKKAAYLKCGNSLGPHSILYATEISFSVYTEWKNNSK